MKRSERTNKKFHPAMFLQTVIISMILSLSFATPAFGAPAGNESGFDGSVQGTEDNPAEAAITKVLEIPAGTPAPDAQFVFTVEAYELNGSHDKKDVATMPTVGDDGTVTIDLSDDAYVETGDTVVRIMKESDSLFSDVAWTHTGVYTYKVTEQKNTYECSDSKPIEYMSYSEGVYLLSVYVNRSSSGNLFVEYIEAIIDTPDNDSQDGDETAKVDPTPGGEDAEGDFSKLVFTNSYYVVNTPDTPDPTSDGVLTISVELDGDLADPFEYFNFDVVVSNPATIVDPSRVYTAYVVDANGIVAKLAAGQAPAGTVFSDGTNDYIEFTTGTPLRIQLKEGQVLTFIDLPIGSAFHVEVVNPKNYTARYVVTINGDEVEKHSAEAAGDSLGFTQHFLTGETANSVVFTHTYRDINPMGIAIDDLPYLMLLGVALLGLSSFIAFFIIKNREAQEQTRA